MLPGRRLYHCSRCLRSESKNDLLPIPPRLLRDSPSYNPVALDFEVLSRVSLSQQATRKVSAQKWEKHSFPSMVRPTKDDLARKASLQDDLKRQLNSVRRQFFRNQEMENLGERVREARGKTPLPPIPAPHAVHCTIEPIPFTWLTSDVLRLVSFNPTKDISHPVAEATRIYENNLRPTEKYFLRFKHPQQLQAFLAAMPRSAVYGQDIRAKIFHQDADLQNLRPGTLYGKGAKPDNVLRHRDLYFRDFTGKSVLVVVQGMPPFVTMGMITYQMQHLLKNESFEWAYEWANRPGCGDKFESNAVLVNTGNGVAKLSSSDRWVFMLKDKENAWRFARKMHMQYYREDRYGTEFVTKAYVLE